LALVPDWLGNEGIVMTEYELLALASTIWIAPHVPKKTGLFLGAVMLIIVIFKKLGI
jgi:hypothetical protein